MGVKEVKIRKESFFGWNETKLPTNIKITGKEKQADWITGRNQLQRWQQDQGNAERDEIKRWGKGERNKFL